MRVNGCGWPRVLLVGSLLTCVAAGVVRAEWASLEGEPAPALEIETWLAPAEGALLADLKGRVVVLLLGGAVDLADPAAVTPWNDLRAGWWAKGLRVVAVVAEEPDAVPASVEFSVLVGKAPAYGSASEARAVLIAADGMVAWEGDPQELTDAHIAPLMRKAKPFAFEAPRAAAKTPMVAAFRKGKLAEARTLADGAGDTDPHAARIMERVSALLAYWRKQAERAEAAGCYSEAGTCLKLIAKHFGGAEEGASGATALKALKANKLVAKETSAAGAYARLRQDLAKALGNTKKVAALVKKAERVAKKKPATRSIERAKRLVANLRADPAICALERFIAKQRIKTTSDRWRNSLTKPPQVEFVSGKTYLWHFETSHGPLTVRFLTDDAPMHVSNAMYLTLLGFYDGLIFHRVIPGFMAQGGCPDGSGGGRIGYLLDGEFEGDEGHDGLGVLSAANAGPGTDSSQFFITFAAATHLDGKHTIYGKLVKGEQTLAKIEKLGSAEGQTSGRIVIEKATLSVK